MSLFVFVFKNIGEIIHCGGRDGFGRGGHGRCEKRSREKMSRE
jgi:hypothetical protein